jgi:spermidine/putrescine transport system permease protein
MSVTPSSLPDASAGRPAAATRRSGPRPFDWRRTPGLGSYTALMVAFLYAPLLILVVYAFNSSQMITVWQGFSLRWFVKIAHNDDIRNAALNSLVIAVVATIASTVIAVTGALALERGTRFVGRGFVTMLIAMPLVVPEIIVAIATLVFFSSIGMHNGLVNLMIAHTVFCIPFALLPVQARLREMGHALEEAGRDLYADEWQLFRRITLPLLAPAIASGAIMAFVVSLDDFLISMMVSSAGSTTLPVYVYGMMRLGVTPEVNAISTILLAVSLVFVGVALLLGRRNRRAG